MVPPTVNPVSMAVIEPLLREQYRLFANHAESEMKPLRGRRWNGNIY